MIIRGFVVVWKKESCVPTTCRFWEAIGVVFPPSLHSAEDAVEDEGEELL